MHTSAHAYTRSMLIPIIPAQRRLRQEDQSQPGLPVSENRQTKVYNKMVLKTKTFLLCFPFERCFESKAWYRPHSPKLLLRQEVYMCSKVRGQIREGYRTELRQLSLQLAPHQQKQALAKYKQHHKGAHLEYRQEERSQSL